MNDSANSAAIITICSHLCIGENVRPFEPSEWSKLASMLRAQNLQPKDLFNLASSDFINRLGFDLEQTERIGRLLDRSGSIVLKLKDTKTWA